MWMEFDKVFLKMVVGKKNWSQNLYKDTVVRYVALDLMRNKLTNHMDTIDIRSRIVEEGKLNRQLWK